MKLGLKKMVEGLVGNKKTKKKQELMMMMMKVREKGEARKNG